MTPLLSRVERPEAPGAEASNSLIGPAHLKLLRNIFSRGGSMHRSEAGGIELDLMARGLIEWREERSAFAGACIRITPLGIRYWTLKGSS